MSIKIFSPFFFKLSCFTLYYWITKVLCIIWLKVLSQICVFWLFPSRLTSLILKLCSFQTIWGCWSRVNLPSSGPKLGDPLRKHHVIACSCNLVFLPFLALNIYIWSWKDTLCEHRHSIPSNAVRKKQLQSQHYQICKTEQTDVLSITEWGPSHFWNVVSSFCSTLAFINQLFAQTDPPWPSNSLSGE